jgi:hypothetical protein
MYRLGHKFREEDGSISVLIIGLFIVLLSLSMILIDITSIYLAKRSLTSQTEALAQKGMRNLDKSAYYQGEFNAIQGLKGILGAGEKDPGIPIDCAAGERDIQQTIFGSIFFGSPMSRTNLRDLNLVVFDCDGFQIYLEISAIASLPVPIPFVDLKEVAIHSHAGAVGERAETNNLYGLDIG